MRNSGRCRRILIKGASFSLVRIGCGAAVELTAKDQDTGKEQKITVSGSTQLSKDEIDRMVKDAQAHSDEDKRRKEEVEARNSADAIAYQVERQIRELGDRFAPFAVKSFRLPTLQPSSTPRNRQPRDRHRNNRGGPRTTGHSAAPGIERSTSHTRSVPRVDHIDCSVRESWWPYENFKSGQ